MPASARASSSRSRRVPAARPSAPGRRRRPRTASRRFADGGLRRLPRVAPHRAARRPPLPARIRRRDDSARETSPSLSALTSAQRDLAAGNAGETPAPARWSAAPRPRASSACIRRRGFRTRGPGSPSTTRSEPRIIACFARASSVAVNPNCATRWSSVSERVETRATPRRSRPAPAGIASSRVLGAGNKPRSAAAWRNGGFALWLKLVEPIAQHAGEQLIASSRRDSRRPIPGCAPAAGR